MYPINLARNCFKHSFRRYWHISSNERPLKHDGEFRDGDGVATTFNPYNPRHYRARKYRTAARRAEAVMRGSVVVTFALHEKQAATGPNRKQRREIKRKRRQEALNASKEADAIGRLVPSGPLPKTSITVGHHSELPNTPRPSKTKTPKTRAKSKPKARTSKPKPKAKKAATKKGDAK